MVQSQTWDYTTRDVAEGFWTINIEVAENGDECECQATMSQLHILKALKTQSTLEQSESKVKVICNLAVRCSECMDSLVSTFRVKA